MEKIVIEIDGARHRLYNKDKVVCGCPVCSLHDLCEYTRNDTDMCEPFLKDREYGHFILEEKI